MAGPLTDYQDALKETESAKREVEKIIAIVQDATNKLSKWDEARVDNAGISFPSGIGYSRSINAEDWPTAERIGQALSVWHKAHHRMDNAYRALPEETQELIQPPAD